MQANGAFMSARVTARRNGSSTGALLRRRKAAQGRILVGLSGWKYAPFRGAFYPKGLRQADELAYAARRFATIEINGSFYSLQKPEYYERWREQTPDDFVFAVKGGASSPT